MIQKFNLRPGFVIHDGKDVHVGPVELELSPEQHLAHAHKLEEAPASEELPVEEETPKKKKAKKD